MDRGIPKWPDVAAIQLQLWPEGRDGVQQSATPTADLQDATGVRQVVEQIARLEGWQVMRAHVDVLLTPVVVVGVEIRVFQIGTERAGSRSDRRRRGN